MVEVNWLKTPVGILKIIAFIVSIITVALVYEFSCLIHKAELYLCFIISPTTPFILFYFIISYLFDGNQPAKLFFMEFVFHVLHAILNLAMGGVIIYAYAEWRQDIPDGEGCVACGVFFILLAIIQVVIIALFCKERRGLAAN